MIFKACDHADRTIWLLASGGEDGVASLGDSVEAGSPSASVVGLPDRSACICQCALKSIVMLALKPSVGH